MRSTEEEAEAERGREERGKFSVSVSWYIRRLVHPLVPPRLPMLEPRGIDLDAVGNWGERERQ